MKNRAKFIPVRNARASMRDGSHSPWVWRLPFVLLAALACTSCTNFFYNRIDNFAASYIHDLVDLNESQSDALERWLNDTLQWHRRSELARYRGFLNQLHSQAQEPQTTAEYERAAHTIESFFRTIAERETPRAARLLCTLNAAQADEFITNLEERDREERQEREERSADKIVRDRTKRLQRQARNWLGRLSKQQEQMIAQHATYVARSNAEFQSRAAWRKALSTQWADGAAKCSSVAALEQLLLGPEQFWTQQYAREIDANRRASIKLLVDLDATLSSAQRQHVREELERWMRILDSLLKHEA